MRHDRPGKRRKKLFSCFSDWGLFMLLLLTNKHRDINVVQKNISTQGFLLSRLTWSNRV